MRIVRDLGSGGAPGTNRSAWLNLGVRMVILAGVQGLLHGDVIDFLAVVIAGAVFAATHLAVLVATYRTEGAPRSFKFLALVPVLTPFIAFRLGKRAASVVWFGVFAAYVAIRVVNA